jgi:regulator of cell morphogenesis and NO signaling
MPVELTVTTPEVSPFAEARAILPRHTFLREQLARAADLNAALILERRLPLCRILLPLHRFLEQLRSELEDYLGLEEVDLFPALLEVASGRFPAVDIAETIRYLSYGQAAVSNVLCEMSEITAGFQPPQEACTSYAGLLHVLSAIHTELLLKFQLENDRLFPHAIRLAGGERPLPALPDSPAPPPA